MKYKIRACNIWEIGPRPKQEDSIYPEYGKIDEGERLFILCDGMGGHSAGEVASKTVCETMGSTIKSICPDAEGPFSDHDFFEALGAAYDMLDTKDNGAEKKMGTTLTFLKLHDKGATIAHIGDSRVYHVRPGKGGDDTEILFQTTDHSLVNDLIKIGELTPEEAKFSKQRNVITRAMQPLMERRSKADLYHTSDIKVGDYFMLCSDGILEQMEDANIQYIFSEKGGDILKKVEMLKKVTAQNHDNHSAILIEIKDVEMTPVKHNEESQPVMTVEAEGIKHVAQVSNTVVKRKSGNRVNEERKSGNMWLKALIALLVLVALFFVYRKYFDGDEKNVNQGKTSVESVKPSKQRSDKLINSTSDKTDSPSSAQSTINQQPTNLETEQSASEHQVEQGESTTATSSSTTINPQQNSGVSEKINSLLSGNDGTVPSSDTQNVQDMVNK